MWTHDYIMDKQFHYRELDMERKHYFTIAEWRVTSWAKSIFNIKS